MIKRGKAMNYNSMYKSVALVCIAGLSLSGVTQSAEIEEVLVTGMKKISSVMETPSAITALTGEDLASRGITQLSELQFAVPSMHYGEKLGNKTIAIRGIGEFNKLVSKADKVVSKTLFLLIHSVTE